jgi:hypothetical protein
MTGVAATGLAATAYVPGALLCPKTAAGEAGRLPDKEAP